MGKLTAIFYAFIYTYNGIQICQYLIQKQQRKHRITNN
jgi:hypothetical protein